MHQVGAGVLGPVFRAYDPETDRTVALKSFPLDLTPEQAAEFAAELHRVVALDLNHPSLIAPKAAGVEGHTAFLVEDYFAAESIDTAIRQYGPAPASDAVRLVGQLAGSLDFAAAVGVHHGALHPRDVLVAPRDVRMTGIGVAAALERVGYRAAARRPYSAPERVEGGEPTVAGDIYSLGVIAHELLTGRRPASADDTLRVEVDAVAAAEPAALAEVFARAFSVRPDDRYPSALAFASALKHALTAQPIDSPADEAERPRSRRGARGANKPLLPLEAPVAAAAPEPVVSSATIAEHAAPVEHPAGAVESAEQVGASNDPTPASDPAPVVEPLLMAERELPAPPPLTVDDLDLRLAESDASLTGRDADEDATRRRAEEESSAGPADPPTHTLEPSDTPRAGRPVVPASADPYQGGGVPRPRRTTGFERPTREKRRISGVALLLMLVFGVLLGLAAGYYFAVRETAQTAPSPDQPAASPAGPATDSSPARALPPQQEPVTPPPSGAVAAPGEPASGTTSVPAAPGAPAARAPATREKVAAERRADAGARAPRAKTTRAKDSPRAAASAEPTRRAVFEGVLSIASKPAGARVFVDGHPVGTTPMTLSRAPAGSHVVRLERDGYMSWSAAIQVVAGEQNRVTASLEQRSVR